MVSIVTENWQLDGIDGVLFDKDGTLIDSHLYWGRIIERRAAAIIDHFKLEEGVAGELCRAMGFDRCVRKLVPEGPIALVTREEVITILDGFLAAKGVVGSSSVLADLFAREHEAFLGELFEYIQILPGVRRVLEDLKAQGIRTAVVTTDTVKNAHETLSYLHIDHLFDGVVGKESTIEAKITGIPARAALKMLGIPPERVICIGDAPVDMIMAEKSGLKAGIGLETGQIKLEDLQNYSPYTAASMQDLTIRSTFQEPRHYGN